MAKLFLSYAREDAAIAERLARALERSGEHDVWWDRDLHGGASFGSEIEQQLRDCDVVIVLWSPAGIQSPWVRDEAAIGRDAGKLIPVSMGAVEPPIGFRQFHTIDIGPHGRAGGAAMEKLKQSIDRVPAAGREPPEARDRPPKSRHAAPSKGRLALGAGAAVLVIAIGAGVYLWRSQQATALTVAIVPAVGQAGGAADYSRAISTDMAAFLSAHGNAASVLDPADPDAKSATYRFSVGYSGEGSKADTSLSMGARGQQGIVWSQSWSVPDVSSVDLKKQMSLAASRSLLCALEAGKDRARLNSTIFKLYVVACSGLEGGDVPYTQIESDFSQIVEQAPRFAAAWQDLALVRSMISFQYQFDNGVQSPALQDAARKAIARARELTPGSDRLLVAESALVGMFDWSQQLPLLERAVAIAPTDALAHGFRGLALSRVGRMSDAIADSERATELDPLSPDAAQTQIFALMYGGRFSDAKDRIAAAYKIWPNSDQIQRADFAFALRYGDPRRAEELLPKVNGDSGPQAELVRKVLLARESPTQANIEDALSAARALAEADPRLRTSPYLLALGTFGKMDEAFKLINDPKIRRYVDPQAFFRPEFQGMRHDPRFMAVAAQYGLARYWRSSGNWPDFCSDAGLPYNCKTEAAKYG